MPAALGKKLSEIQLPHAYAPSGRLWVRDLNYPLLAPVMFNTTEARDNWLRNWLNNGDCCFESPRAGRPRKGA